MPEYTFQCDKCETIFTITKKMTDPNPEACVKACTGTPRRVWTADFTFAVDKSTDSYVAGKPGGYEDGVAEGAY